MKWMNKKIKYNAQHAIRTSVWGMRCRHAVERCRWRAHISCRRCNGSRRSEPSGWTASETCRNIANNGARWTCCPSSTAPLASLPLRSPPGFSCVLNTHTRQRSLKQLLICRPSDTGCLSSYSKVTYFHTALRDPNPKYTVSQKKHLRHFRL